MQGVHAAGYLPEVWQPDEATEQLRHLVSRRAAIVQGMTRTKNRIHAVLLANLIPPFAGKLFLGPGRQWLAEQPLSVDERAAVDRWLVTLDGMEQELAAAEAAIASACLGDDRVRRLMTIGGISMAVAAGVLSAIGDVGRFASPPSRIAPSARGLTLRIPCPTMMPNSARCERMAHAVMVRCCTSSRLARCSRRDACCSGVFAATNRMFGRVTASQIDVPP